MRSSLSILISLWALLSCVVSVFGVPTQQRRQVGNTATYPDPNDDPFYRAPSNLSAYSTGQVIRSRQVPTDIGNTNNAKSYQLFYRTTNTQNQPSATVATIWIPSSASSTSPKIFSYQVYEDSTQLDCAPSWAYISGFATSNEATVALDTPIVISWALQQGYYVVSADHEGPNSAFIAGFEEGRAILDGIKALQAYSSLPASSPVGFYGYSGGAHATVWATSLAASYAPSLNIVGAAHGGTPVATRDIFNFLNKGPFAGFAIAGVSGLGGAYPDFESYIESQLNARGKQVFQQIRSRNFCLGNVVTTYPFVDAINDLTINPNLLNAPQVTTVLNKETLLTTESSDPVPVPKFPRFIWHALEDEIVPYVPASTYVSEQCAQGANIFFTTFPVAEHITAELLGLVPGLIFLKQAFDGTTPKVLCGTPFPQLPTPNNPQADQVLGSNLANQLRSLNGKTDPYGQTIQF